MNQILRVLTLVLLVSPFAFSQSLGEIARQNREIKRKPAARVYTNDDIASRPAEMAQASNKSDDNANTAEKDSKDKSDSEDKAGVQKTDNDSDEATQKKWEQYKSRIADQKAKIDLLQRELEVAKRQNEIQMTEYYADAGARLRNPEYFSQQMTKYQNTVDAKTKAIQDANNVLESIRDEGRKAGVPSSYLE